MISSPFCADPKDEVTEEGLRRFLSSIPPHFTNVETKAWRRSRAWPTLHSLFVEDRARPRNPVLRPGLLSLLCLLELSIQWRRESSILRSSLLFCLSGREA